MVDIILRKFDTLSKKEIKMIKAQVFDEKQEMITSVCKDKVVFLH